MHGENLKLVKQMSVCCLNMHHVIITINNKHIKCETILNFIGRYFVQAWICDMNSDMTSHMYLALRVKTEREQKLTVDTDSSCW